MIGLRPISWLPRISMGLTIARLSARLRCAECGGPVQSVAAGRRAGQATRVEGDYSAATHRWNSTKQQTLFSKRLARLSNRGAYLVHTFPSPTEDRKGIGHAMDPDPFGVVRHSLPFLSVPLTGNAATASAESASYYFTHSRISFQRYSSAVRPPRIAVKCSR